MTLHHRLATGDDIDVAQEAYRRIKEHLAATVDYPHWHTANRPRPAEVAAWIAAGDLHLAMDDGDLVGVVVLNHEAAEAYDEVAWGTAAGPEEVLVVHALGVVPERLGSGVSGYLVDVALDVARGRGCRAVRLDTYVENLPARRLYERSGFTDLGRHALNYEGTDLNDFHVFEYVLNRTDPAPQPRGR